MTETVLTAHPNQATHVALAHEYMPLAVAAGRTPTAVHIVGSFRAVGASPDGDSVRFYPQDPQAFAKAGLVKARPNSRGGYQLRLDGIDALETHFTPPQGRSPWHQPRELATGAADQLLKGLGFSDISWDPGHRVVTSSTPTTAPGYILASGTDVHGRVVSFACAGTSTHADVSRVALIPDAVATSINLAQLRSGKAYPTYYSQLPSRVREAMTAAVEQARAARTGVWASDATTSGFEVTSALELQDQLVILPKLFRRLAEFLRAFDAPIHLDHFMNFLIAKDDEVTVLPSGDVTRLDALLDVQGNRVRLLADPTQLVFREK